MKKHSNSPRFQKFAVLFFVSFSLIFMLVATAVYPGGSLADKNAIGFDWTKNFFSNLFAAKAINGEENTSRLWAIAGMAFHALGNGIFYLHMAKKMPAKHPANILKFIGWVNVLFTFLIATPMHDAMITVSSSLSLLGIFYITVFVFRGRLLLFKIYCSLFMLMAYYTLFLYGAGNWGLLAIMQKIALFSFVVLVLALEYFTRREDFFHEK